MSVASVPTSGTLGANYNDLPQIFLGDHTYAPERLFTLRGGKYRFIPDEDVLRDVRSYAASVDPTSIALYLAYVTLNPQHLRTIKTSEHSSFQSLLRAVLVQLVLRKLQTTCELPAVDPAA